jgi:hypothetical protein
LAPYRAFGNCLPQWICQNIHENRQRFVAQAEFDAIMLGNAEPGQRQPLTRASAVEKAVLDVGHTTRSAREEGRNFLCFFARNFLKNPDSGK